MTASSGTIRPSIKLSGRQGEPHVATRMSPETLDRDLNTATDSTDPAASRVRQEQAPRTGPLEGTALD